MIAIKEVSITPNIVNTGESVFISIKVKEITWEDIKNDFSSFEEIKNHFINWDSVEDYDGVK